MLWVWVRPYQLFRGELISALMSTRNHHLCLDSGDWKDNEGKIKKKQIENLSKI